ncbi:hypothetical protein DCCM_2320 [Desulfocucumis palustris]|uniref:Uncharacterized protein n=1 Tax=Desulfocucumis palustris TaxID=1898651 RepID=A0A2L2XH67_9FIRM|nr:hypothetical protein [Desulfocucumis palustris]GBF33221.1 hypothetical protein DCCM_2320 [Desulfocucumis palustris]
MIIINRQNIIKNRQIEKVLKLLGGDYRPARLVVYETRLDVFRFFFKCFNLSREELSGKLEGTYHQATDSVYVFVYAQTDDGDDLHSKQLYSLHAMSHELRHRYQYVKGLFTKDEDEEKSESDADRFATNFINNNSAKIKKIMGWSDEWTVEEED